MAQMPEGGTGQSVVELATFFVGDALCGMDILKVREINKIMNMTKVPQAPEYVRGILNLRGRIITIIDLGKRLGLSSTEMSDESCNIIIDSQNEYIGLLVDRISDVVQAETDKIEPTPANMGGGYGKFVEGVFKTEEKLIGILDVEAMLNIREKNVY